MTSESPMRRALMLAEAQLGQVWPNPAVGAVIVQNNQIIGEGATAKGGRPHAETLALSQAGGRAKGATLYVTLEPCAHHGQTPPCVDAIIAAGIKKVVISCRDPDPRTAGKGAELLKQAGISVELGVNAQEAAFLNRGFFSRIQKYRPHVLLKMATSHDMKILRGNGKTRWITGAESQHLVHQFRAHYDAVLTTINTVNADNPMLNCRIAGMEHRSPVRIVLDRHLKIPINSAVVSTAKQIPLWIVTEAEQSSKSIKLEALGARMMHISAAENTLHNIMQQLASLGITRVMVEAGATLPKQLLDAGLVDEICWFRAPNNIHDDAEGAQQSALQNLNHWGLTHTELLGSDTLNIYNMPSN